MKRIILVLILFLFESCSSVKLVKNWKNPDIDLYVPTKVFIVGLTSHETARFKFEKQLQEAYTQRNIEAITSVDFLEPDFVTKKLSEQQLDSLETMLIENGFDTILFSKVIRIEDRVKYKKDYYDNDQTNRRFKDEYMVSQNLFFNSNDRDEYKVYHLETTMYCICPTKDRELLWKGYIDIVDPVSIDKSINNYVKLAVKTLEKEQLLQTQ